MLTLTNVIFSIVLVIKLKSVSSSPLNGFHGSLMGQNLQFENHWPPGEFQSYPPASLDPDFATFQPSDPWVGHITSEPWFPCPH